MILIVRWRLAAIRDKIKTNAFLGMIKERDVLIGCRKPSESDPSLNVQYSTELASFCFWLAALY